MFITDPKDGKPSVSLTILIVSFCAFLIGCGLEMYGKTKSLSGLSELYFSSLALYFGRRMNIKGNSFEVSQSQGNEAQKEIP